MLPWLSYPEVRQRCLKLDENSKPFYCRYVTHTFSTLFCWAFQRLPFSPNQLTFLSLVFAIISLPFFLCLSRPFYPLIGAFFLELYYVFDAIDGQWARLKAQKSLTGAFFDYLINYAIQPPLLFAIAWGVHDSTQNPLDLALGFVAAFSTLWLIVVWNLRQSVLYGDILNKKVIPKSDGESNAFASGSLNSSANSVLFVIKQLYSIVYRTLVFPWMMNIITLLSLSTWLAFVIFGHDISWIAFRFFIYYCAIGGLVYSILITAKWIIYKEIRH